MFFDEVILYEDELDDNGQAVLAAKIRVMPSGFFVLVRFYLRVDAKLVRVVDTRLHHVVDEENKASAVVLREYSERECSAEELASAGVNDAEWRDINAIAEKLTVRKETKDKIVLEKQ